MCGLTIKRGFHLPGSRLYMHHLLLKTLAGVYLQYCMSVNIEQFEKQPYGFCWCRHENFD